MEKKIIATVQRYKSEPDWTLSEFKLITGQKGFGVEDEIRQNKVHGETAISAGIYELDLRYSPKFSKYFYSNLLGQISDKKTNTFNSEHLVIWVKGVPGFEFILWHWGNTDDDTDGCYLVGSSIGTVKGQRGVLDSKKKYIEIYPSMFKMISEAKQKGEKVYVEYKNAA